MSRINVGRLAALISIAMVCLSCVSVPEVSRLQTALYLLGSGTPPRPLPMSEFSRPAGAGPATAEFTGVLRLVDTDSQGEMEVLKDPYDLVGHFDGAMQHLPDFEFAFVQRGADLVPLQRGVIRTQHRYWEYILQPGRVWSEPDDGDWSRASLPFSLQERSANCTHNGVMTWLFDGAGNISRVAYQVVSETCGYFQANLWGVVSAEFDAREVSGAGDAIRRLDAHRAARLPVKPIGELATDYAGVDPSKIGAVNGVRPEDMSVYGFIVDGVHYRSDCFTRYGAYPDCDSLPLPSYSTAKSIFAGIALMRMERRHPGISALSVASLVPECPEDRWTDVSLEDALDMATGNFFETAWDADEDSKPHVVFLDDDSHAAKIEFACTHFPRQADPGTLFVYHTSDTYVLGTALQNFVARRHPQGADLYRHVIVEPIWDRLGLSPLLDDSKRTYDAAAQPFAGYGLTFETDDIARIALWLSQGNGELQGEPQLDEDMLAAAMQRKPDDPGLVTSVPALRYNNGFWGFNAAESLGCDTDLWVPFMSGYGGISVAMLPNDTIYYYFSDGYVHRWASAVVEAARIRPLCPAPGVE
jgi:hypothetical protein